jgi:hypothetical protein
VSNNTAHYRSGEEVVIGDVVLVEGNVQGVVSHVLQDSSWVHDKDDPVGIYIETKDLGLLRYSPRDPDLVLVARARSQQ